jgi:hypothetical protein
MKEKQEGYCLIQDDDGHWYVIPKDKQESAYKYFEAIYKYYDDMPEDEDEPEQPKWLDEVGGAISNVVFSDYKIL